MNGAQTETRRKPRAFVGTGVEDGTPSVAEVVIMCGSICFSLLRVELADSRTMTRSADRGSTHAAVDASQRMGALGPFVHGSEAMHQSARASVSEAERTYCDCMSTSGHAQPDRNHLDKIPLPTVPGLVTWHRHLREMVEASPYNPSHYGPAHGIAQRFVQDHTNPKNELKVPGLEGIYAIDRGTNYKIVDQVKDLFALTPGELDMRLPLWEPRHSAERLLEGLRTALGWSHAATPSVYELAESLQESCASSGDAGRWRARIFDIEYGHHFTFAATRALEFLRWYGSDTGIEGDPQSGRALEYLNQATYGFTDSETAKIGTWLNDTTVPDTFQPDLPGTDRQGRWDTARLERAELIMRMGTTYAAARGEWTGGYGLVHQALLRHHDNATGRHIFLNPLIARGTGATPQPLADDFSGVESIVLLGVPAVAYPRIGFLVGEALGWPSVHGADLAQRLTGRRFHFQTERRPETFAHVFEEFRSRPKPYSILSLHLDHLMTEEDGHLRLLPSAVRLLRDRKMLPVLLAPRFGNESLLLWEERQIAQSRSGRSSMRVNTAAHCARLQHLVAEELRGQPGVVHAELQPSLPWAGPAVHRVITDDDWDAHPTAPEWFLHPLVGDIMVRASYEIARYLLQASMREPSSPTGFAAGSTVARYERSLRACTRGAFWTDDSHIEAFDESYIAPLPRGNGRPQPRPARTVNLTHAHRQKPGVRPTGPRRPPRVR
ncbi:hypothetical protein ABKW28_14590 [Nocardioides sp. 31GB23]|uniref:hypothetical protein n=1 Tax=Nocardioides sp. 31GB23 TaxID=3156065 RepID=UPI0032AEEB4D